MRVLHIVPHIDKEAAGPSYSVPRLCATQQQHGADVELVCLASKRNYPFKVTVLKEAKLLRKFSISFSHLEYVRRSLTTINIVHSHSLWSWVNFYPGFLFPHTNAKLVCSPRGTLSKWALSHNKVMKRIVWPFQKKILSNSQLIHVTSEQEYQEVRSLGFKSPVIILPNGVDIPDECSELDKKTSKEKKLLFLSRIHPKKGLDILFEAWSVISKDFPNWELDIVGTGDDEHVQYFKKLSKSLALERVKFTGPLYGEDKSKCYFNSDLFVLPTYSENFGMVVAESLAHSTPVIVSNEAPWEQVIENDCGWCVDNNTDSFVKALREAMTMPDEELAEKGCNGANWMEKEFSWDAISAKMLEGYQWLNGYGEKPNCIRCK